MSRNQRTFSAVPLTRWLSIMGAMTFVACGGGGGGGGDTQEPPTEPPPAPIDFDYSGLLLNLADNVIGPTFSKFQTQVSDLDTSVQAYCGALASADEATALTTAQASWETTMRVWQQAEMMQVEPLSLNDANLRNNIYTFALNDSCAVDQEVAYLAQGDFGAGVEYDISLRQPNRRGLDAMEYLLFNAEANHSCPPQIAILQGWNELPLAEKKAQRCALLQAASADLKNSAETLVSGWTGEYRQNLVNAGDAQSSYDTAQKGLNAITDAMFYIESYSKDLKVAKPLGLLPNSCAGEACPADLESQFAFVSKENLADNLTALEMLFLGKGEDGVNGLGFDDWLVALEEGTLAATIEQDIAAAIATANGVPTTLKSSLETDVNSVNAVHTSIKQVTDQLKTDFIEKLQLELPSNAASDND